MQSQFRNSTFGVVFAAAGALAFSVACGSPEGATGATDGTGSNGSIGSIGSIGSSGGSTGSVTGDGNALGGLVQLGAHSGECGFLPVTFRDFKGTGADGGTNPDFELSATYPAGGGNWRSDKYGSPPGSEPYKGVNEAGCDLVQSMLDPSQKPIFNHGLGRARNLDPAQRTPGIAQKVQSCAADYTWPWDWTPPNVINNADTFSQWYNDVPGVNMAILGDLKLTNGVFESTEFFPLDNQGFGNTVGEAHNYHFTTEAHVKFTYTPGAAQTFTFVGDDDLWIFVNGILAVDLGGVHEPMEGTIDFDARAADLGITAGGSFTFDIFHAERQTTASNFKVTTNIECFEPVIR